MKHHTLKKAIAAGAAILVLLSMSACGGQAIAADPAVQVAETPAPTIPETTEAVIPETAEPSEPEIPETSTEEEITEETREETSTEVPERSEKEETPSAEPEEPEQPEETVEPQQPATEPQQPEEPVEPQQPATEPEPDEPSGDEAVEDMEFVYAGQTQNPGTHPGLQAAKPDTGDATLDTWLSFMLEYKELTLEVGQSHQMAYTYYGTGQALTWRSEDPDVISVDSTGQITALAEGQGTVVVFSDDCGARTCEVTVVQKILTKEEQARAIAQEIAYIIMNDPAVTTDIERIAYAARFVNAYVAMGHTSSFHEDCRTAYGVFVAGYSNCVGSTKATGLVLEYMGYAWSHVNANTWGHQWCEVYGVDGQTAWCDGSAYGVVGYGQRQEDMSNWLYMTNQGDLVYYADYRG